MWSRVFCLVALAGCGFGDNLVARGAPDAHAPIDARADAPTRPLDAPHAAADAPADAPVITQACALFPQADCTGATPACDLAPSDDGSLACRAVTKQGTSNDHCADDTQCRAGFTCIDLTATQLGACARFCEHDTDCTGTGSRCVISLDGSAGEPLALDVCSNACEPNIQTGCPSQMGCVAEEPAAGSAFTDCIYQGTAGDGDACAVTADCAIGFACVDDGTGTTACAAWCVVGDDTPCDDDSGDGICTGFATPATIGAVEYGACE